MSEFQASVVDGLKSTSVVALGVAAFGFLGADIVHEPDTREVSSGHVRFEPSQETTLSDRFEAGLAVGVVVLGFTPTIIGSIHARRQRAAVLPQPRHRL